MPNGEDSWESLGQQRQSNQSILKEISPGCSSEGLMLKLKLQYFGHLMQRTNSLKKTLMLGKTEGRRKRGWQRIRWLDGIIHSMDMSLCKFQETVKDRGVHGVAKSQTQLNNWTTTTVIKLLRVCNNIIHTKETDYVTCNKHSVTIIYYLFCMTDAL